MDRAEASDKIKTHCKTIALEMMDLNPAITHLDDQETQEALFEASYELTKQLEIIKKRVIKLERRGDAGAHQGACRGARTERERPRLREQDAAAEHVRS